MKLVKIYIKNFLSIKDEQELKINDSLTTLVGLNEAGKTTILKAIEKLNGKKIEKNEKNKCLKSEYSIIKGIFSLSPEEVNEINNNYKNGEIESIFYLPNDRPLYVETFVDDVDDKIGYKLLSLDNNNCYYEMSYYYFENIKRIMLNNFKNIKELNDKKYNIPMSNITKDLIDDFINIILENNEINEQEKEPVKNIVKYLSENSWSDLIPNYEFIFFSAFRDVLGEKATISEIEENKRIQNIFRIADINFSDLNDALVNGDEPTLADIENKYIDIVTKKFKSIFNQVDDNFRLKLRIGSANKEVYFLTQDKTTGTDSISIVNRSDGFRWYLSMYLTLYDYIEKNDKNNKILLLDEPNLYLHAGAQKDLLERVFKKEFKGLQIIYSTHSPYMIDAENTFSIRIIEKDEQTHIYNSTREYSLAKKELVDVDALTPLMTALQLNATNGLMLEKSDNIIIVEGIQDLYILSAMQKKIFKEKMKFKIVPCFSSEKVPYMFSYLYGLGYKICILVDNDKPGRKAIKTITRNDENNPLLDNVATYNKTIDYRNDKLLEDLFSEEDRKKYIPNKNTIEYKDFLTNIENNDLTNETINNFKELFNFINKKMEKIDG